MGRESVGSQVRSSRRLCPTGGCEDFVPTNSFTVKLAFYGTSKSGRTTESGH